MLQHGFAPGFRFSTLDGFVLVIGIVATALFGAFAGWLGLAVAFVVGHFFLFCNVFRISRDLELVWAAVFVGLCSATLLFEVPAWEWTVTASSLVTILVVGVEMRKPSYHGVGWRRINPGLPTWWETHCVEGSSLEREAEPEARRVDDGRTPDVMNTESTTE